VCGACEEVLISERVSISYLHQIQKCHLTAIDGRQEQGLVALLLYLVSERHQRGALEPAFEGPDTNGKAELIIH